MSEETPVIEVTDLVREFNGRRVLNGLSFKVMKGDTMIIMGGSGCGKSTLLRHIIGAMKPTSGSVKLFGEEITGMKEEELAHVRRRFGMLFQSGALLQSLTVGENVALPIIEHGKLDPSIVDLMVKMKLEMVGLTGFENLKPAEISGGMKKRVGLARAIVTKPACILYDEPTTGLDPIVADSINWLIRRLQKRLHVTSIVVTHDMKSAFHVADRIAYLHEGKIYFQGSPEEMRRSTDPLIRDFIEGRSGDSD